MRKQHQTQTMPEWAPRLVIITIVSIILAFMAMYVIYHLQDLLSWLVLALFLSFALEPLVNQLTHRGWNRALATSVVIFSFLLIIIVLFASMIPLVVQQTNELIKQSPSWLSSGVKFYNELAGTSVTERDLVDKLTASENFVSNYIAGFATNIFDFGRQVFLGLLQLLGVVLFTFFFVLDGPKLRRIICSFLSPAQQKVVLNTWELAIEKTGGFMYSRLILGSISAIAHFIVFALFGIPFALPLAIWMGVISQFVPIIGTYIAAALPILMGLTQGVPVTLLILSFIVLYQQVENYFLLPKIASKTMELHPAVAFAAVIAGATLGGVIGAFIALPLAAMAQEIFKFYIGQNKVIKNKLTHD